MPSTVPLHAYTLVVAMLLLLLPSRSHWQGVGGLQLRCSVLRR